MYEKSTLSNEMDILMKNILLQRNNAIYFIISTKIFMISFRFNETYETRLGNFV